MEDLDEEETRSDAETSDASVAPLKILKKMKMGSQTHLCGTNYRAFFVQWPTTRFFPRKILSFFHLHCCFWLVFLSQLLLWLNCTIF